MPKPVSPPTPVYGSPEWKAMRAKMVGTPEWKEATGYKAPPADSVDPMAQGVYFKAALPFTPAGKILTTAEKQAQSPLYNPLYDPSSMEYRTNLIQISTPRIQNPLVQTGQPNVQIPKMTQPIQSPTINTADLAQTTQNKNQVTTPNNPLVKLPEAFQQSINPTPSVFAPVSNQGIKMPSLAKNSGLNSNWNDLYSVANNRFTR